GEVVGFRAILSENPYNVNAAALEDNTEICFISKQDFNHYKESNPQLQNRLIQELSSELQEWADFVTDMTQKTVRQRTALALVFLHEAYNEKEINVAREDLANMVGTATESLIRLINEFKKEAIISISARRIKVIDIETLKSIAEA
ncbi:MAG: Crp/Fnr family transcriptional regulator, partial [Bacteroidota bacterium]|nr:Crp/Fnr family transcriptional regulator [Bacteroidota bacterium]